MDKFQIGQSYGVMHMDDRSEQVTIAARDDSSVTLADGRRATILHGAGPTGEAEELFRLDEDGPVARGGVVRACHHRAALDASRLALKDPS